MFFLQIFLCFFIARSGLAQTSAIDQANKELHLSHSTNKEQIATIQTPQQETIEVIKLDRFLNLSLLQFQSLGTSRDSFKNYFNHEQLEKQLMLEIGYSKFFSEKVNFIPSGLAYSIFVNYAFQDKRFESRGLVDENRWHFILYRLGPSYSFNLNPKISVNFGLYLGQYNRVQTSASSQASSHIKLDFWSQKLIGSYQFSKKMSLSLSAEHFSSSSKEDIELNKYLFSAGVLRWF